jgi:hypothetical protein
MLLDRWYRSDAVFRDQIDATEVVEGNVRAGVRIPDIAFTVTCRANILWNRAHQRQRRLDGRVISNYAEHATYTDRFQRVALEQGWNILRSDSSDAVELSRAVISAVQAVLP